MPDPGSGPHDLRIVGRSTRNRLVFVTLEEVWAFEARERLVFVRTTHGCFDVDVSLSELESRFAAQLLRVHRNWLVGLAKVRELRWRDGLMHLFVGESVSPSDGDANGVEVPVGRDQVARVRRRLLAGAFGVVARRHGPDGRHEPV